MRVFFVVFLFILSSFPSFAVPDSFSGDPKNVFTGKCSIHSSDIGDLNKDGIDDYAFILFQDTYEDIIEEGEEEGEVLSEEEITMKEAEDDQTEDSDASSKEYDVVVAIYFGDADGTYLLYNAWNNILPKKDISVNYEELYSSISPKGVLSIHYNIFYGAGTWWWPSATFLFRYENDKFRLIGEETNAFHRATGEGMRTSVNYLTGKQYSIEFNMFEDKTEKPVWSSIEKKDAVKYLGDFGL